MQIADYNILQKIQILTKYSFDSLKIIKRYQKRYRLQFYH